MQHQLQRCHSETQTESVAISWEGSARGNTSSALEECDSKSRAPAQSMRFSPTVKAADSKLAAIPLRRAM
eukprot:1252876-Amphidinium_carterae.1